MATETDNSQRGLSRSELRVLCAVIAAFLMPGFFVSVLTLLLPNHGCVEGQSCPQSLLEWALVILGMSVAGALLAAPIVVADLILWWGLHRVRLCRLWAFCLLGLVSGLIGPALLWDHLSGAHGLGFTFS